MFHRAVVFLHKVVEPQGHRFTRAVVTSAYVGYDAVIHYSAGSACLSGLMLFVIVVAICKNYDF